MPPAGPGAEERIVVSRLRFLGDVVLSTPTLEVLREARPRATIEYVTCTPFAAVLAHHPAVDRVLTLPMDAGLGDTLALVRALRAPRVDWFIDLLSNPRSALQAVLSRPRRSVGQSAGVRSAAYTFRRPRPTGSQVAGHLDKLVPLLGPVPDRRPRVYVTDEERRAAAARFGLSSGRPEIFLHPGATWPWREWPTDRWPLLARRLAADHPQARLHVVAPPGAPELARDLAGRAGVEALPALSIRELMAVLSWGALFVGNDGGILHTAVALGVPTVGIFGGENDPREWFPYAHLGPYRSVLASSTERLPDGKGRHFPRPDATPDEVADAAREVMVPEPPSTG